MSTGRPLVVHVLAADASVGKLAVLQAVYSSGQLTARHRLVHVGPAPGPPPGLPKPVHLRAPLGLPWLGTRAVRRVLEELTAADPGSPCILHAWTPRAASWAGALACQGRPLLVEIEADGQLQRVVRPLAASMAAGEITFACPTALARLRLSQLGVSAACGLLIRESVDLTELERAEPTDLRRRLKLEAQHKAVVALPPVSRRTGTLFATWATLLAREAHPDVRLVVPATGPEHQRVRRLVRSCLRDDTVRFVDPSVSLAELAVLADLIVYLPLADAPVTGLLWAMATACPIVATAVPAVTELLVDGQNTWLCQPADPRDAARRMLQALDYPQDSRRQAETARSQSPRLFDRQRMIEQYQRAYANLAAGRPARDGLHDP